ncbi:MAG: cation-transporting P-type ATPase, partial [Clostridia bacterium]|nr:cation-transporting P-type ATPase [Clostridia bacterium]
CAKKLNTDVSLGLDKKEAERRRRRGDGGSVYKSVARSPMYYVTRISADITVIIFVIVSLLCAFFYTRKSDILSIVLALVSFASAIISSLVSGALLDECAEKSIPRARVIRSGKLCFIDARNVVTGDIIVIKKGDIIPCDCRLISSNGMRAVEFTGVIGGREKKELNEKDACAIYRFEEKLGIAAQKNMLTAAAVVSSGSGKAIAVKTGRKTFISQMLGELEAVPGAKREMKSMHSISALFSRVGLFMLILALPLAVITMLVGKNETGILDVLMIMLSLALVSGSEIISGFMYNFLSCAMKKSKAGKKGACIKYPSAIQELNYIDSVMIMGDASLSSREKNVESIFAANKFYDSSAYERDQTFNCLLDLALLGTLSFVKSEHAGERLTEKIRSANAIAVFAEKNGIDKAKLRKNYQIVEFSSEENSGFDTSLIKNGEEYRVICVSDRSELLDICSHIRTPEGALPLDADKKEDILRACSQLKKKSKSIILVASRISPCSSLSRLGAVQNQLIFEGYIVYSAPYTQNLAASVSEMQEADINVYYFAEEKASSVITAFNIGVVKGKYEIAYASAFKRSGKAITDELGRYRAYLGFSAKDIEKLASEIRGENGTLAVIGSETENLSVMKAANVSAAVSNDDAELGNSEIALKNADIILAAPDNLNGGFESFAKAVLCSKNACTGMGRYLRYMAFSLALKLMLSIVPLLLGKCILSAAQIIFLGVLFDIPAMLCFSGMWHIRSIGDKIEDIETLLSHPIKCLAKHFVSGAVLASVVLMLAAVFGSSNIASGSLLSVFAFLGAALSQLFAVLVIGRF